MNKFKQGDKVRLWGYLGSFTFEGYCGNHGAYIKDFSGHTTWALLSDLKAAKVECVEVGYPASVWS